MNHWYWIAGLRSREELQALIDEEGSVKRVAQRGVCSRQTVAKAMKKYGLSRGCVVGSEESLRRIFLR